MKPATKLDTMMYGMAVHGEDESDDSPKAQHGQYPSGRAKILFPFRNTTVHSDGWRASENARFIRREE